MKVKKKSHTFQVKEGTKGLEEVGGLTECIEKAWRMAFLFDYPGDFFSLASFVVVVVVVSSFPSKENSMETNKKKKKRFFLSESKGKFKE